LQQLHLIWLRKESRYEQTSQRNEFAGDIK